MPTYLKHVIGFVSIGATALACTVSAPTPTGGGPGTSGTTEPQSSSSSSGIVSTSSGGIVYQAPEALPPEYWTAVKYPGLDGNLAHYFPSAPGSATGGWSTGTCDSDDAFCNTDEYISSWVGPNTPSLGSSCVAAQAQKTEGYCIFGGRCYTYLAPYTPTSRAAGVIPLHQYCVCGPVLPNGTEYCSEPAYLYVMCPWQPTRSIYDFSSNLDWFVNDNPYKVMGLHATQYLQFTPGSTVGTGQGTTPIPGSTNAVIYEIDPQCGNCAGNGPPCN
jgi:hypothetical protein